jgi:hypothetical protein
MDRGSEQRVTRWRGVVVVAVATGLALAGCTQTPQASPPVPTTAAAVPTPTDFQGDVRTLLLTRPGNATPTAGPSAPPEGKIDLANAAAGAGLSPSQMRTTGFIGGATGEWIEPDQTWVGIIIFQFTTESYARQWADRVRAGFKSNSVFPAGVSIPGVPDGVVYARDTISGNGRWFAEAVFSKGTFSVELFVTGPVRHDPQKTIDYALAQYARLP